MRSGGGVRSGSRCRSRSNPRSRPRRRRRRRRRRHRRRILGGSRRRYGSRRAILGLGSDDSSAVVGQFIGGDHFTRHLGVIAVNQGGDAADGRRGQAVTVPRR